MTRTFNENHAVRAVHTPATYAAAAVYGTWQSMAGYRRCTFILMAGELDGDIAVAVYEATSAAGAGAQALVGLSNTFHNGDDESNVGIIEVRDADMSDGFTHITVLVTPASTDGFSCVAVLSEPISAPVSNVVADNVAFNTGE